MLYQVLVKSGVKEGELPSRLVCPKNGELHFFLDKPAAELLQHQTTAKY